MDITVLLAVVLAFIAGFLVGIAALISFASYASRRLRRRQTANIHNNSIVYKNSEK